MLVYGAFNAAVRPLVLVAAGLSKVALLAGYLLAVRGSLRAAA
jgi:hypothetical protein